MPLNNPSKSLTPFLHRHLVNTPNSGKGCSTGAQNSARVCLYAEHGQAKPWTFEWLRSPSRTSVPSVGQDTESPAKCLLFWSPKCCLVYLMNRETKAQCGHFCPFPPPPYPSPDWSSEQQYFLGRNTGSADPAACSRMNKPLRWYSVTYCLTSPLGYFVDTCWSLRNLGFKKGEYLAKFTKLVKGSEGWKLELDWFLNQSRGALKQYCSRQYSK